MTAYRIYKRRLSQLERHTGDLPPAPSAAERAEAQRKYEELCVLFQTKYNLDLRSCRVTPRREKTLTSEEYFKELWRVLTPYPEAKTFVRDWMRETIARREVGTHVERTGSVPEDP